MSPVLKLSKHDEKKEMDFEVRHQMGLTTQERFEGMISASVAMIELANKHGYNKTPKIIKRK